MCGIIGRVSRAPLDDRSVLDFRRDTLQHRGPDDFGSWWSADGGAGLAHRRLSIIDLGPGGHQPMVDPEASLAIVYNGEIYNFIQLREELEKKGVVFKSSSDTEVLLKAYRVWGEDCLDYLDGMFAFAVYDENRRTLFMARDRTGEKPLYYRHVPGQLHFASELKALMADPQMERRIDPDALNSYLAFGYVPGSQCILSGVEKLPPACCAVYRVDEDRLEVKRYWELPREFSQNACHEDELADRLEGILRESVRRRLVSDVPVGIMLSGGIDSSLVTAMAAGVSDNPVRTFTITFPGHEKYNEGPYARKVAEYFSTDHVEMPAEAATVDLLPELARQYDEPLADSSMVPTFLVTRQIRRHATVALGGDGGDELFGGYPGHSWVQSRPLFLGLLPWFFRRMLLGAARGLIRPGRMGRNYILGLLSDTTGRIVQVNKFFDPRDRKNLMVEQLGDLVAGNLDGPESWKAGIARRYDTPLRMITGMDFASYLPDDILVKVDRASMLSSLEVRSPFLGRDVMEFAFREVPDSLRATSMERKILTRRLASRLLPADLDLDRKQGFSLPLQAWFRGQWGKYIGEVLMDGENDVFRRKKIEQLLEQQAAGRRHTQRLFALAMFELWRREYSVSLPGGE